MAGVVTTSLNQEPRSGLCAPARFALVLCLALRYTPTPDYRVTCETDRLPLVDHPQGEYVQLPELGAYIQSLRSLASAASRATGDCPDTAAALNGSASCELERLVALEKRRELGAFFTPRRLADRAYALARQWAPDAQVVYDPACGAGNLLLPFIAGFNQEGGSRELTLRGGDVCAEFVRAAELRLRLALGVEGLSDHAVVDIRVEDGLQPNQDYSAADLVVMNPPFFLVDAPGLSGLTSGRVNGAARFVARAIERCSEGATVVAVLPEVLRSGARYAKWRRYVESRSTLRHVELHGQFSPSADVHVFIAVLQVGDAGDCQVGDWVGLEPAQLTVGHEFEVRIGQVVDYRDPHDGPELPYAVAKEVPPWVEISQVQRRRRWAGTTNCGPLVLIRRTSRPEQDHRAIGSLVTNAEPLAVDNHLIVVRPKSGMVWDCRKLMNSLQSPQASEWLNARIRLRHLTVGSVRDLPLFGWQG